MTTRSRLRGIYLSLGVAVSLALAPGVGMARRQLPSQKKTDRDKVDQHLQQLIRKVQTSVFNLYR